MAVVGAERGRAVEAGAQVAHGIDQQLAEDGQRGGGEVGAAPGEPDVHGGLAAGDDGTGQGAQVELVDGGARGSGEALAGGVDDLLGAVVPGFQFGAGQLRIRLGQAVQLGQGRHRHGIGQLHQGRARGFKDGFVGGAQPELLQGVVQEAVGHRGQCGFGAAEVVEEGPAGDPGGVGDVLDGEVPGPFAAQQCQGGVGDGLAGGGLVEFAARRRRAQGACRSGSVGTRLHYVQVCTLGKFFRSCGTGQDSQEDERFPTAHPEALPAQTGRVPGRDDHHTAAVTGRRIQETANGTARRESALGLTAAALALGAGIGSQPGWRRQPRRRRPRPPSSALGGWQHRHRRRPGHERRRPRPRRGRGVRGCRELAAKLGVDEAKVTDALKAFREANKPTAAPAEGTKPDRAAMEAALAKSLAAVPRHRRGQGHGGAGGAAHRRPRQSVPRP